MKKLWDEIKYWSLVSGLGIGSGIVLVGGVVSMLVFFGLVIGIVTGTAVWVFNWIVG